MKGSVLVYILVAVFLSGLLALAVASGPRVNPATIKRDAAALYLDEDIRTLRAALEACARETNGATPVSCADGQARIGALTLLGAPFYAVDYVESDSEGVFLRFTGADPAWQEAARRAEKKRSACEAAVTAADPDPLGGACRNGCLYIWLLRRKTSSPEIEPGCP